MKHTEESTESSKETPKIEKNALGEELCPRCQRPFDRVRITLYKDGRPQYKQGFCDVCRWVEDL